MAERGSRWAARCVHTVPDWTHYVRAPGEGFPIFAACRLLVKEGGPVEDARAIACGYWGRQPECPLFEGPGRSAAPSAPAAASESARPEEMLSPNLMRRASLTADDYARRGPRTDGMRQRRRASSAGLALLALLAALAAWLAH